MHNHPQQPIRNTNSNLTNSPPPTDTGNTNEEHGASSSQQDFLSPNQRISRLKHTPQPNMERDFRSLSRTPSSSSSRRNNRSDGGLHELAHVKAYDQRLSSTPKSRGLDSPHFSGLSVETSDLDPDRRRRRYRPEGSQLSPHSRHYSRQPSPSSPVTPSLSVRSKASRTSSVRRNGGQSSDAEQMANDQNLNVISRRMTSYRVVHMLYQTDADLFDAIQEWKETHPDLWVDDAIDAFGKNSLGWFASLADVCTLS